MDWFSNIKTIYGWGRNYYTNANVARFVELNRITEEQYKQITGLTYPATEQPISVDVGGIRS
ncbi:XkdX family protein [Bacillus sp. L381]|uniref:XkdX family protein n=1 Tax=Bacillus sp. L381 TaxID=2982700 RepID=UPI00187297AB|nr:MULTISPECIES: XkdX family protein [Bacillus]MCR9038528.1 XkdX family protein [Bacillus velezensis]QOQ53506.1 XkdX family protein [Bacillus amyloliquefaciens]QUN07881.1 XkdX family protein [Bacillus amyloliquefaciens]QYM83486.1 XkdX family protein [Bacillus sp. 7D3]QZY10092.1 XkdX family protein [Bacillus amyloliquefaciens]